MYRKESLKTELFAIQPPTPEELLSEFIGLMRAGAVIKKDQQKLSLLFSSRYPALIKKCITQKKVLFSDVPHLTHMEERKGFQGGIFYCFELSVSSDLLNLFGFQDLSCLKRYGTRELAPHFLRGIFEARGYMSDPIRGYHLEIQLNSEKIADLISGILQVWHFHFQTRTMKGGINLYLKNSQIIADFIRFIGAHQTYL